MSRTTSQLSVRAGAEIRTDGATWLQRFLALDAVVTTVNGIAYLVASGPLGRLFESAAICCSLWALSCSSTAWLSVGSPAGRGHRYWPSTR